MSILKRMAANAPVPVFLAEGTGGNQVRQRLAASSRLQLVASPRQASILLVAGDLPGPLIRPLQRLHDQMPHPRLTAWINPSGDIPFGYTLPNDADEALDARLQRLHRQLVTGGVASEPDEGANEPPAPFEGRGDHGQGGEGMMGGTPWGRPMAMTAEDRRDRLALDAVKFEAGPWLPGLPAGLQVRVTLQGDVIQSWETLSSPLPANLPVPFYQVRQETLFLSRLEVSRAIDHLHRIADMLLLDDRHSLALRVRRVAGALDPALRLSSHAAIRQVQRLEGLLRRTGFFFTARGCGRLSVAQSVAFGSYAARAAGEGFDARKDDTSYRRANFSVVAGQGCDIASRRRQLLDEIYQSLQLTEQGTSIRIGPVARLETPIGASDNDGEPQDRSALLDDILPGMEWHEAMQVMASLPIPRAASEAA